MAKAAQRSTEQFAYPPNRKYGQCDGQRRTQFKGWVTSKRKMDVGKVEEENDESPYQHICQKRNPGLAAVRFPRTSAPEIERQISNVRKLVRKKHDGDSGSAQ